MTLSVQSKGKGGENMKKKFPKIAMIIAIIILAVAAIVAAVIFIMSKTGGSSGKSVVYADTVDTVMGYGSMGSVNRYSGVVETQKTIDIKLDSDKSVKTIFVEVGDTVSEGTPLFEYDTDEMNLKLAEANLDVERLENSLKTSASQIEQLEKEKKKASADEQLGYTAEILQLQSSIQQTEYDIKIKQLEIDSLKEALEKSVVTSTAEGVIKSVNEKGSDEFGSSSAFMTIVATGDYRIKGKIDEQNVYDIYEGMPVLVYSRTDDTVWTGSIKEIDTENTQDNNNNGYYYYDGGESEKSSTYAFYIELDNGENLLIGQHVYIEPDFGQYNADGAIKLMAGFIVQDEENPYVWAIGKNDKLEKRVVTLGAYDDITDCFEIVDGLALTDYIAFPTDYCKEGVTAIKDTGKTIDESIYHRDDEYVDDYYGEEDHTYDYDDETGMLYEYDADGNLVSTCDSEGNMTYFDADGNPIEGDYFVDDFVADDAIGAFDDMVMPEDEMFEEVQE